MSETISYETPIFETHVLETICDLRPQMYRQHRPTKRSEEHTSAEVADPGDFGTATGELALQSVFGNILGRHCGHLEAIFGDLSWGIIGSRADVFDYRVVEE